MTRMILSRRGEQPPTLGLVVSVNTATTGGRPSVAGADGLAVLELHQQVLAASQALLTHG